METKTKLTIGALWIVLLATAFYVSMDDVRMRIDNDKSVFYINDSRWLISGIEYNKLFNGSKIEYRDAKNVKRTSIFNEVDNISTTIRNTPFKNGARIIDTYIHDGKVTDLELFPVSHTVEIFNATGFIYQYEVKRLVYNGTTMWGLTSPQSFGRNMKVEWDSGNYYSRIYKYKYRGEGKLTIKYRIYSDYVKLNMRLFDPEPFEYYSKNTTAYLTANEEHFTRNFEEYSGNWLQEEVMKLDDASDFGISHGTVTAVTDDTKDGIALYVNKTDAGTDWVRLTHEYGSAQDFTAGDEVHVWVKSNSTLENRNCMWFGETNFWVSGFRCYMGATSTYKDSWHLYILDKSACSSVGVPEWDNITWVGMEWANSAGNDLFELWIDDLKLVDSDGYTYNPTTGSEDFTVHSGNWSLLNTTDENGVETDVLAEQTHITTYQSAYRNQSFSNITMTGKYKRLSDTGAYVRIVFSQTLGGLIPGFRFDPNEFTYNEGGDTYGNTTNDAYPFTNDTWISFKFEITSNGNNDKVKGRVWNSTDTEPTAWDFDRDSTQISDWYYVQLAVYDHTGLFDDIQIVEHQTWANNLSDTGYIPSTDNITAEFMRPEGVTGEAYAVYENARNDSAIACYSFEDDYTDQCAGYDLISGSNNELTSAGKYGSGLKLTDGYVRQTTPFDYENQSLTYCAWTYLINTTWTHPWVIGESDWTDGAITMGYNGKPQFTFQWKSSNGTSDCVSYTMPSDYMYNWYHICGVMDYETMASIYVNGINVANTTTPTTWGWRLNDETRIGNSWGVHLWNGTLDEVRIYDSALSASAVSDLYEKGKWKHSTPKAIAQWSINGDVKDTSVDCVLDSTTCDNGTLTGDASITKQGRFGEAVTFDGSGDYITVPNSDRLNITNDITISVWANLKNVTGQQFIAKPTYHQHYEFSLSSGHMNMNWRAPDIQQVNSNQVQDSALNSWHMYSATVDCDKQIAFFYLDGVDFGNDTTFNQSQCIGTDDSKTTGTLWLGMRSTEQTNNLTGSMDEIAIYNFTLTAQQIADLYNRTFKIRNLHAKDDWNVTIHVNVNNSYVNTTSQQMRVEVPAISLQFNGTEGNASYYHEDVANITANISYDDLTVCLSSDYANSSTFTSCNTGTVQFDWTAQCMQNTFHDDTTDKLLNFYGAQMSSIAQVRAKKYNYIQSIWMNVTGLLYSYIVNTLDGSSNKEIVFSVSGTDDTNNFTIYNNTNITSAVFNITGTGNNTPIWPTEFSDTTLKTISMVNSTYGWAFNNTGVGYVYNGTAWNNELNITFEYSSLVWDFKMINATFGVLVDGFHAYHFNGSNWNKETCTNPIYLDICDFTKVDMINLTDGWITGYSSLYRWNGTIWVPADNTEKGDWTSSYSINDIDMIDATDGWMAADWYYHQYSQLFRWNGTRWSVVQPPAETNSVIGISEVDMVNSTYGWISNHYGDVAVWNGSTWTYKGDISDSFYSISMVNDTYGWITGGISYDDVFFLYNGTAWNQVITSFEDNDEMGLVIDVFNSTYGWVVTELGIRKLELSDDPHDVIVTIDSNVIFNHTGRFNSTNTTSDFTSIVNNYLDSCVNTNCQVPLNITTSTTGKILINNILINGSDYPSNITVCYNGVEEYNMSTILNDSQEIGFNVTEVICTSTTCDNNITFTSDTFGTVNITEILTSYYGYCNFTISATSDYADTVSNLIEIGYPNYDVILPNSSQSFSINATSNNGTFYPHNQTSTMPIFNMSSLFVRPLNFTIKLNQSLTSCISGWIQDSFPINRSLAAVLNTTEQRVMTNLEGSNSSGLWVEVDYDNCTVGTKTYWTFIFKSEWGQ